MRRRQGHEYLAGEIEGADDDDADGYDGVAAA
jgi:hypothetical protein